MTTSSSHQSTSASSSSRRRATVAATGLLLACLACAGSAFVLPSPTPQLQQQRQQLQARRAGAVPLVRLAAAGEGDDEMGPQPAPKGFGAKKKGGSGKKAEAGGEAEADAEGKAPPSAEEIARLNARQRMAYWEIQKEMEREMDLAEIEEYKETQRLLDEGAVGYLPEKISNRMLKRLIPFISMPLLGAGGMFGFYLYLAKNTDIEVPPAFVAFSTQVPFLGALAGITYSIMSTSWDPDVEGSFWGVDEFKANVLNLLESLQKSKREERAKEKMKKYEAKPAPNRAKRRELDRLIK